MDQSRINTVNQENTNLFGSDSEISLEQSTSKQSVASNCSKGKFNYSNYSALFDKSPSEQSLAKPSSSTDTILSDYSSFKRKLAMKKSLHK